jgi:hypothetical protein
VNFNDEESAFECLERAPGISELYHAKQRKFTDDAEQLRCLIGGRRSGKTTVFGGEAIEVADQFPGLTVPYVAPTVGRARDIMMPQMLRFRDKHGIPLEFNLGEYKIYTPNGGCIQLCGLATKAEVEKGRGGSYPALYIDECGAIHSHLLETAVQQTYGPATKDFLGLGGRGIALGGTPQAGAKGYWERVCGGNSRKSELGASVHHMTIFDNPFFAGREELVIRSYLKEQGFQLHDAPVQREWFGLFCIDARGLAYPHWTGKVWPMHLMPLTGFTTLGVDLGSDHPCAWVVVRWHLVELRAKDHIEILHHGHVLESYEESGLSVHDVAAITKMFQETYDVGETFGDSGGGGKMTVDSVNSVLGVNMKPVVKAGHKEDRIWMVDSMLANGTLHVHDRCDTLAWQLGATPKERKSNGLLDHMAGYPDHSLDALHYSILGARQHKIRLKLPPKPGTPEWAALVQRLDDQRAASGRV